MVWGYLQMTGRIEQPFVVGLKRMVTLAVVLGVALKLWLYNSVIVDTFYQAPVQLAAAVAGAPDPVKTIDAIWDAGGTVADYLFLNGNFFHFNVSFYLVGVIVWILVGLLCVYTMFLLSLSSIALSVSARAGAAFLCDVVIRAHAATIRCLDRAVDQLRPDLFVNRFGIDVAAAAGRVIRASDSRAGSGSGNCGRTGYVAGIGFGVSGHAASHAHRGGARRRRIVEQF